jgi:hypothetical protein
MKCSQSWPAQEKILRRLRMTTLFYFTEFRSWSAFGAIFRRVRTWRCVAHYGSHKRSSRANVECFDQIGPYGRIL